MQKIIRNKEYNTETAQIVGAVTQGAYGEPDGYEEKLFQTPDGFMFLYGFGGAASPYPVETIKAVSRANAEKWTDANL